MFYFYLWRRTNIPEGKYFAFLSSIEGSCIPISRSWFDDKVPRALLALHAFLKAGAELRVCYIIPSLMAVQLAPPDCCTLVNRRLRNGRASQSGKDLACGSKAGGLFFESVLSDETVVSEF